MKWMPSLTLTLFLWGGCRSDLKIMVYYWSFCIFLDGEYLDPSSGRSDFVQKVCIIITFDGIGAKKWKKMCWESSWKNTSALKCSKKNRNFFQGFYRGASFLVSAPQKNLKVTFVLSGSFLFFFGGSTSQTSIINKRIFFRCQYRQAETPWLFAAHALRASCLKPEPIL